MNKSNIATVEATGTTLQSAKKTVLRQLTKEELIAKYGHEAAEHVIEMVEVAIAPEDLIVKEPHKSKE